MQFLHLRSIILIDAHIPLSIGQFTLPRHGTRCHIMSNARTTAQRFRTQIDSRRTEVDLSHLRVFGAVQQLSVGGSTGVRGAVRSLGFMQVRVHLVRNSHSSGNISRTMGSLNTCTSPLVSGSMLMGVTDMLGDLMLPSIADPLPSAYCRTPSGSLLHCHNGICAVFHCKKNK